MLFFCISLYRCSSNLLSIYRSSRNGNDKLVLYAGSCPFAALGFINYQGMNAEQIFMTSIRSLILQYTNLIDQPYNLYYEIMKDYIDRKQKEGVKKNVKKLRKNKKTK